jgi:hypothetical protein
MDDLIARAQSKAEEVRERNRRDEIGQGHNRTDLVNTLGWVSRDVEVLLGPNDVDVFPVIHHLAEEGNVLE